MKYVISKTGEPFQFAISRDVVYSFDTQEPVAISESHLEMIVSRIGSACLGEVDAPAEKTAPAKVAPAASTESKVEEPSVTQE